MHRLRLSDGRGQTVEFLSQATLLGSRVNDAYLSFCQRYRHAGVILEVFHGEHGWQPVYDDQGYCRMIQNPLRLDYHSLKKDIHNTLTIVDSWPSRQQWVSSESRRRTEKRQALAESRRRLFKVIAGGRM